MSDTRPRDAERRALSGSVEDQARALVARLRTAPGCERCGGTGRLALVPGTPMAMDEDRRTFRPARPGETPYGVLREDGSAVEARPGYYHRGRADTSCPSCVGTGSPFRARVELAAYCGDEAPRAALGGGWLARDFKTIDRADARVWWGTSDGDKWRIFDLGGFAQNLSRWADVGPHAGWVLVLASVAAARVALAPWEQSKAGSGPNAGHADTHSDAPDEPPWPQSILDCPECTNHAPRRAIEAAEKWLACPCEEHERAVVSAGGGSPGSRITFYEGPAILLRSWGIKAQWEQAVLRASELAGESPVLNAIRSSLIEWSLGGER
jgi:hypothetical protein